MTVVVKPIQKLKDSSRPIFFKSFLFKETQIDEESRVISGYAAVWNNKDDDSDILLKGCCAKSISERGPQSSTHRKIKFCWQHDTSNPLGNPIELKEDDYGLWFKVSVDKIPEGDRCLAQLKSGTLDQFSIGYNYIWDKIEYDGNQDAFFVKEISLFEFSVVTFGMNENTYFAGMKSSQIESEKNKLLRETERILKSVPYEQQLELRQLIAKHISLTESEPLIKTTLKVSEPNTKIDFSKLSFYNN